MNNRLATDIYPVTVRQLHSALPLSGFSALPVSKARLFRALGQDLTSKLYALQLFHGFGHFSMYVSGLRSTASHPPR
jgi:hypothetical protein